PTLAIRTPVHYPNSSSFVGLRRRPGPLRRSGGPPADERTSTRTEPWHTIAPP
ncbi:Hypothetical predicted protein, partial [Pelobates cultripes]